MLYNYNTEQEPVEIYEGDESFAGLSESDDDEAFAQPSRFRYAAARPVMTRPPLQFNTLGVNGGGVKTAILDTPKGQAQIRLQEKVATHEQFKEATQQVGTAIARTARRVNDVETELQIIGRQLNAVEANTRRGLMKVSKEQKAAIAKVRKDNQSQASTNLLFFLLFQQQFQKELEDHTHPIKSGETSTGPAILKNENNNNLLLLFLLMPGMMTGSTENSGDNNSMTTLLPLILLLGNKK